jgi:predicted transposase YbfD/YdcC
MPLIQVFAAVADFRHAQGLRYPLAAILALATAATLCGYRSYGAIAEWGRNYGRDLAQALGFRDGRTPSVGTLHTVFRHLDRHDLETFLNTWAESILASLPPALDESEGLAIDGKCLRGSARQGILEGRLVSVLSHRLGLTVLQHAVPDKTNEIPAVQAMLTGLLLTGRVITLDALHTQRKTAQAIVDGGGEYVLIAKGNQAQLHEDIALVFQQPAAPTARPTCETTNTGHGRIEQRRLITTTDLNHYCDWPGVQQVFEVTRTVLVKKTGEQRAEVVYGLTSLAPAEAGPADLLGLVRQHWHVENKSHWVRDVTFDEDRSSVRSGSIPHVMAALRNTAIGLLRYAGETNIAAAGRRLAAQPWVALALIGIQPKTE